MKILKHIKKRGLSFKYAIDGLKFLFVNEVNAKIHLCLAALAVCLGFYFNVTTIEWLFLVLAIGMVIGLEAVNTSIEKLCDEVTLEHKKSIKQIKDLAAAAVLIAAICALIIGGVIFVPYIMK